MVLDTDSLRVAFVVVALTMLTLFYFVSFRSTRSAYCLWWCLALALFVCGSAAYLLNGTEMQRWANPLGNGLVVGGAACVWTGARSLRGLRTGPWRLGVAPGLTMAISMFDHPATNKWSGGVVFLAMMSLMIGLASLELWREEGSDPVATTREPTYAPILRSMAVVSGLVSGYYLCRWVAFVAVGQDGHLFTTYFGSQSTTLISTVLLATVSFSMSSLSNQQLTEGLREKATRDGLTGLLNRDEFMRLVREVTDRGHHRRGQGVVILADLDHFKAINDTFGHQAGDGAIKAFANACVRTVRVDDLVGRYGGDEFILLLPGVTLQRAKEVTAEIAKRLKDDAEPTTVPIVSASFGIALTGVGQEIEATIAAADVALYRAKALGRDQVITSTGR